MRKKIRKSIRICLSKLTKSTSHLQHSLSPSRVISGCRHPKTHSFDRRQPLEGCSATLTDIDRFLCENFSSLYHDADEPNSPNGVTRVRARRLIGSRIPRSSLTATSDEGSGSSFTTTTAGKESDTTGGKPVEEGVRVPAGCIAVLTYSPNPHEDFQRSMQEVIETRFEDGARVEWEFMEDLLFCYLGLNDKTSYRYILSAFVDLVVLLRRNYAGPQSAGERVETK